MTISAYMGAPTRAQAEVSFGTTKLLEMIRFFTFPAHGEPVVRLSYGGEVINLRLAFETDPEQKAPTTKITVDADPESAQLLFTNVGSDLGMHNDPPQFVGTIGGHILWLRWNVVNLSSGTRDVTLCFYVGGKVNALP